MFGNTVVSSIGLPREGRLEVPRAENACPRGTKGRRCEAPEERVQSRHSILSADG